MAIQTSSLLEFKELQKMTDNFSEANYIGYFMFGKVYRGEYRGKAVTVKRWIDHGIYEMYKDEMKGKMNDEISLLEYESLKAHPNLAKIIGSCYEDDLHIGIVYDLSPLDNVRNLLPKDSFDWKKRIKVAVGLARAINSVHTADVQDPVFIRSLDPSHVMCDQDYNPTLFEFGMVSGGKFGDRIKPPYGTPGSYGHTGPYTGLTGQSSTKDDVFAYGVILFSLMSTRAYDPERDGENEDKLVWLWAKKEYQLQKKNFAKKLQRKKCPKKGILLVEDSLKDGSLFYASDARKLTKLGLKCFNYYPENRPTMRHILDTLLSLRVVKESADFMGVTDDQLYGDGKLDVNPPAICTDATEGQPCVVGKVKVKPAISRNRVLRLN